MKRLIVNAKEYNERASEIFADAERIRKMLSNFMREHNPAYQNPEYQAVPTPVPREEPHGTLQADSIEDHPVKEAVAAEPREKQTGSPEKPLREGAKHEDSQTPIAEARGAPSGPAPETTDFKGMTFQQAQDQLIQEFIKYKHDEYDPCFVHSASPKTDTTHRGLEIYFPFVNLPSRTLTDYYRLIKEPVSLKGVQKKVRGYTAGAKHRPISPTSRAGMLSKHMWREFGKMRKHTTKTAARCTIWLMNSKNTSSDACQK